MDTTEEARILPELVPAPKAAAPATNGQQADDVEEPPIDSSKEIAELVLDTPIDFDGKHYERLTFDFKGIRRRTWKAIRITYKGITGDNNPMPIEDEDYHAIVAAEAAQVPLKLFDDDVMSPSDWKRVDVAVVQFIAKTLDPRLTRPRQSHG